MLGLIASLALAAGAAHTSTPPAPSNGAPASPVGTTAALPVASWWEKITVTMDGTGKTESCKYESSSRAQPSDDCAVFSADMNDAESQMSASDGNQYTRLTFERRFSPGVALPSDAPLATGDTLLGREIIALAIDRRGKVTGCKVLATSGDMPPDYSCHDASAERFALSNKQADARQGFFTIRIYGHSEHVVMRDQRGRRV